LQSDHRSVERAGIKGTGFSSFILFCDILFVTYLVTYYETHRLEYMVGYILMRLN
jgi:hypothetical protein